MIAAASSALRLWIRPELLRCEVAAENRDEVLGAMAATLAASDPLLGVERVFEGLRERERLGSTGIGEGCAIPHARLPQLRKAALAVIRTVRPVEFGASDGKPVRLFFGLVAPGSGASEHLQILAAIARWLRADGHREALLTASSPESMLEILSA